MKTDPTFPDVPLLKSIVDPADVAGLSHEELEQLAKELRETIIHVVSKNGGHLAPSLGVIELTLALYKTFDFNSDKLIWDVGHQAYAHKLLTGRLEKFNTLRQFKGISGFPKLSESPYDHFGVGHSSTSISAALGMAVAGDLNGGGDRKVVAVIGDGSMTGGLAFEGLNQAGGMHRNMMVVLNDNEMSISKNVGALSSFLSRNLSSPFVVKLKKELETRLKNIPAIGPDIVQYMRKSEGSFKSFFTPGMLFEAFLFNYLGPIDGHSIEQMTQVFERVKTLDGPVLVHVLTKKGKGYDPAETNPTYFHGVGCFEPETGNAVKFASGEKEKCKSYTEVFGTTLCRLAEKNEKVFAITAAMPEGTGLTEYAEKFPDRFVDVGICEQHAVTFAAGLALEGLRPVVAVYSTFLQRSFDQIIHDVCLQNLPVVFCLDRGGLVGEDGPTHHGAFDLSYLRQIPNMVVMAPKDEAELQRMLVTALHHDGPIAVRYPRGVGVGSVTTDNPEPLEIGTGEFLRKGEDALVAAVGSRVYPSLVAAQELEEELGHKITVLNARFVKPLPVQQLEEAAMEHDKILLVEENTMQGGFGSAVLEHLCDKNLLIEKRITRMGLPDRFVEHGAQKQLRKLLGIDKDGIKKRLKELLEQ